MLVLRTTYVSGAANIHWSGGQPIMALLPTYTDCEAKSRLTDRQQTLTGHEANLH